MQSFCNILSCYFEDYRETEVKKISNDEIEGLEKKLEAYCLFALTWSFGCTGDMESRQKFDKYVRKKMTELKCAYEFPSSTNTDSNCSIFDFSFDFENNSF